MPARPSATLLALILACTRFALAGPAAGPSVTLTEIVQTGPRAAPTSWITAQQTNHPAHRLVGQRPVWQAAVAASWLPGWLPVFAVERRGMTELRRRPPRGQENFTEPLFFALPAATETGASDLAGPWHVRATNSNGSTHHLGWELTVEAGEVSGRFDPDSEYRFAFITDGTWRSNRLELRVENVSEKYEVNGELRDGRLAGSWRHLDGEPAGTWSAERPAVPPPPGDPALLIDLWAWTRPDHATPFYGSKPPDGTNGWKRSEQPLGRVWRLNEPVE